MSETTKTIRVDRITQSDAAHTLYVLRLEGGMNPGNFTEKLIEAIFVADLGNLERLERGFEGLVAANRVYKKLPGGTKILQEIAAGIPYDMPTKADD